MAFVPPLFSKLGKSATDLFTKKYNYKNELASKNKTKSGLTFTQGLEISNSKGVNGNLKLKLKQDSFGEAEGQFTTTGGMKGTVKAKKLVKNAVFIAEADGKPKNHPKEPLGKVGVEYTQDNVAAQVNYETSFWKHSLLHAAAVLGFDGLSIGGEVKADPQAAKQLEDFGAAVQYDKNEYTVTVKTTDKCNGVQALGLYKINADHNVGVCVNKKLSGGNDDSFSLGTEYKMDTQTKIKAKADTKGIVSGVVETRMKNPNILLNFATSVDAGNFKNGLAAKDFGVSFLFGDYEDDD
jgi:hypothetical protein